MKITYLMYHILLVQGILEINLSPTKKKIG